jgi:mono/diheme cytochrome c family protein
MVEGERLYRHYGCGQCHSLSGLGTRGEFGADLAREGVKDIDQLAFGDLEIEHSLVGWLYSKLKEPRAFGGDLKMPDYHFSDEEARQVTAALLSLAGDSIPPEHLPDKLGQPRFEPAGPFGRIMEKYQCLACHRVRGSGGDMAPDLTREGSVAKPDWLARYFDLPYTLRPIMTERMPNLGMTPDEIETTLTYLSLVLVDDTVPAEIFSSPPDRAMVDSGKQLFYEKYGCDACHQVYQKGGYVGPPLDGVRDHLHSGYIYEWLLDPQRFIPNTIEPKQGMTQDEAMAITAFLYSLPSAGANAGGGAE